MGNYISFLEDAVTVRVLQEFANSDQIAEFMLDGCVAYSLPPSLTDDSEDTQKQCIVLMGLPAAGKSTFVSTGALKNLFPGASGFKVMNSDKQLERVQYTLARMHFKFFRDNVVTEEFVKKFKKDSQYKWPPGVEDFTYIHPITLKWWEDNGPKGSSFFYKAFRKLYYASHFDLREVAKKRDDKQWGEKIETSGNIMVIDTVASKPKNVIRRMEMAAAKGFACSVIYLERPAAECITNDKWRWENQGRGVGESVIMNYAKNMETAFREYQKYAQQINSKLYRIIHCRWKHTGTPQPHSGVWPVVSDKKYRGHEKALRGMKRKVQSVGVGQDPGKDQ